MGARLKSSRLYDLCALSVSSVLNLFLGRKGVAGGARI
jgi:hypothetical protein